MYNEGNTSKREGQVLAVHTDTTTSAVTTSSSSYSDTGLTVTFTPTSIGSTVLISYTHRPNNTDSGGDQSVDTGFNIAGSVVDEDYVSNTGSNNQYVQSTYSGQYIYTTTSLSPVTIKLQHKYTGSASSAKWHIGNTQASLVVMAIVA
jgi:hypothetical protein